MEENYFSEVENMIKEKVDKHIENCKDKDAISLIKGLHNKIQSLLFLLGFTIILNKRFEKFLSQESNEDKNN